MNTNINQLTARQLRDALEIREKIDALEQQLATCLHVANGNGHSPVEVPRAGKIIKPRRTMSASARRRIAIAQRARWANIRSLPKHGIVK